MSKAKNKFQVKIGEEFELVVIGEPKTKVTVIVGEETADSTAQSTAAQAVVPVVAQATQPSQNTAKTSIFADWKITSVAAIAVLTFTSGAYAAASGDYALFNNFVETVAKVATEAMGKK